MHYSALEIAPHLEISRSSVQRIVRKRKPHVFKRISTPQMDSGCGNRRLERCSNRAKRFSVHSLPRLAFQDEKDFTVQVKTNRQNNSRGAKADIDAERLLVFVLSFVPCTKFEKWF